MNSAEWFNRLETILEQEASHAGLLDHGTMIGNVREFITRRMLQSFLPTCVHFGAGKVIDSKGSDSRQVDVLLFDSRFPHFSSHGVSGLYPVEGVLATIEVKSTLTKEELGNALNNCFSVSSRLPLTGFRRSIDEIKTRYTRMGMDPADAHERGVREELVPTYIFSFHGPTSANTLGRTIVSWIDGMATEGRQFKSVHLPRLIVAGKLVAVLNDGIFNIERATRDADKKVLYLIAETEHRFGWLATHLLASVCDKLGSFAPPIHPSALSKYVPIASYIPEFLASSNIEEVAIDRKVCQPIEGWSGAS